MKRRTDRRQSRKRLFGWAGATLLLAFVAGGSVWFFVSFWLAALTVVAGVCGAAAILHRPGGVPILVYHSVSPDADWLPWAENTSVRPEVFRRHLEVLKRGGWRVLSTKDFVAFRRRGAPLQDRAAVLHFDDGYLDNFLFAAPILREYGIPATVFVSTDFIDQSDRVRNDAALQTPSAWRGYMNAAELRAIDADPLFDVEAHGTDHARVPVSDLFVDQVSPSNWRRQLPLAWALDSGNKARWFEADHPPETLQMGEPVRENESALTARWYRDGTAENPQEHAERIGHVLKRARDELAQVLGRRPEILAWPFDQSCPSSIAAAQSAGFSVVTGGHGENRPEEDPEILSRVHVQDRAFGGGPVWLEGVALRARVNAASGRLAWHLFVALAARLRRLRYGRPGYGAAS